VHWLLPAYYLFAGRPQRGDNSSAAAQIQVLTLAHVYMAAQASLLDIQTRYEDVADRAPGALLQDVGPELGHYSLDRKYISSAGGRTRATGSHLRACQKSDLPLGRPGGPGDCWRGLEC
jgi:hypothetical protein